MKLDLTFLFILSSRNIFYMCSLKLFHMSQMFYYNKLKVAEKQIVINQ